MFPFELREQALCKLPHRLHHTNPWEGATCRTYFHCWMLSLFVAPPVRAITWIQTGVLASVTHQPLLTFRTGTHCLCPSPSAWHRAGKLDCSLEIPELCAAFHWAPLVSRRLASSPSPVASTALSQLARSLLCQQLLRQSKVSTLTGCQIVY